MGRQEGDAGGDASRRHRPVVDKCIANPTVRRLRRGGISVFTLVFPQAGGGEGGSDIRTNVWRFAVPSVTPRDTFEGGFVVLSRSPLCEGRET